MLKKFSMVLLVVVVLGLIPSAASAMDLAQGWTRYRVGVGSDTLGVSDTRNNSIPYVLFNEGTVYEGMRAMLLTNTTTSTGTLVLQNRIDADSELTALFYSAYSSDSIPAGGGYWEFRLPTDGFTYATATNLLQWIDAYWRFLVTDLESATQWELFINPIIKGEGHY